MIYLQHKCLLLQIQFLFFVFSYLLLSIATDIWNQAVSRTPEQQQTSQSKCHCWSYYFSTLCDDRPKRSEQYNASCTLKRLYGKERCTDTTLPTEGSAALRSQIFFFWRGLLLAGDRSVRMCFVFMRLLLRHNEQLHITMETGGSRLSQRGSTQIWSQLGSKGEMIPAIIIT